MKNDSETRLKEHDNLYFSHNVRSINHHYNVRRAFIKYENEVKDRKVAEGNRNIRLK